MTVHFSSFNSQLKSVQLIQNPKHAILPELQINLHIKLNEIFFLLNDKTTNRLISVFVMDNCVISWCWDFVVCI